ncbi:MAG: hypothetical protein ACI8SE_001055 [Bacteroidia bacterium]|jgi:hypothetical protein
MMTVLPKGDPNPLYIEGHKKYCPNGVELAYTKYQYVRDTVIDDRIMYEGYHIEERWYDCNGTLRRYVFTDPNSFTRSYKKPENTVVETVSDDKHIIIYTVGHDTFQTKENQRQVR